MTSRARNEGLVGELDLGGELAALVGDQVLLTLVLLEHRGAERPLEVFGLAVEDRQLAGELQRLARLHIHRPLVRDQQRLVRRGLADERERRGAEDLAHGARDDHALAQGHPVLPVDGGVITHDDVEFWSGARGPAGGRAGAPGDRHGEQEAPGRSLREAAISPHRQRTRRPRE